MIAEFKNEAFADFASAERRATFQHTLEQTLSLLPKEVTPIVNGKLVSCTQVIDRENPSAVSSTVGRIHYATEALAQSALEGLRSYQPIWERVPAEQRAACLMRAATIMRAKRDYLSALMCLEVGKNWVEADKDTCEAIDFCEFYAREMLRLDPPRLTMPAPAEDNHYLYDARGVVSVISPWNFPCAIACGMAVAALVAGNTVAFKPAEQASVIAGALVDILYHAGIPKEALAFLPGQGESVGNLLVESPLVDMIVFTGSKSVGLEIVRKAAVVHPGQRSIKKVVTELGGKNAIIVDEDADLDEAAKGIITSAFGYSGQKCSACSRLILHQSIHDRLLKRLAEAIPALVCGPAMDPSILVGPVVDREAQGRLLAAIDKGKSLATLVAQGSAPTGGHFVPPTLFANTPLDSFLWRDELFGPVVAACRPAKDFEDALALANDTEFGLTGGYYGRLPSKLAEVRRRFKVGNLYINRHITGALVCRQPFGGFRMSGIGSKAGGVDYLLQFLEPRTITENTMRRGFAPESK